MLTILDISVKFFNSLKLSSNIHIIIIVTLRPERKQSSVHHLMIHDHHPHVTTANMTSDVSTRVTNSSTSDHSTTEQLDLRDQRVIKLLELHDQRVTCIDECLGWSDLACGLDLQKRVS